MNVDIFTAQKNVALAYALECTLPKRNCTSRFADIGPKQKFEYFLTSGINTAEYFGRLARRINTAKGQPKVCYDLIYEGMINSNSNTNGKNVSYGLIEPMAPAFIAVCAYGKKGINALRYVPLVLKRTSKKDVGFAVKMREYIYKRSDKAFKHNYDFERGGKNLFEHYTRHSRKAHRVSSLYVKQLLTGMPLCGIIYSELLKDRVNFGRALSRGFDRAYMKAKGELPYGAIADYCAVAIFLYLSDDRKIIF